MSPQTSGLGVSYATILRMDIVKSSLDDSNYVVREVV